MMYFATFLTVWLCCRAAPVLRPAGHFLFNDALVIGGLVTNEELATRSSMGLYVFAAPGENEKLLEDAGFDIVAVMDKTSNGCRASYLKRLDPP